MQSILTLLAQGRRQRRRRVLFMGETGTGKGLLAQVVHEISNRRDRPFVQVNCAALPEQLLESELFGYVHGAFTGAMRDKTGLFEEADGGTIFLDEIEKVPESVQAKLLHVLDSSEIRPVGATRSRKVDARVICATGCDLRERIKRGPLPRGSVLPSQRHHRSRAAAARAARGHSGAGAALPRALRAADGASVARLLARR